MAHMLSETDNESNNFPVKSKQIATEVNSIRTELVCNFFSDRTFIIVTQYQKVGNLVSVSKDVVVDETGSRDQIVSTKVLLGKDEPLTHVVAKTLTANFDLSKPVLLSFALKDTTAKSVKSIAKVLAQLAT